MCVFFSLITKDFLNFMIWGWLPVTYIKMMMLREKNIDVLYLVLFYLYLDLLVLTWVSYSGKGVHMSHLNILGPLVKV